MVLPVLASGFASWVFRLMLPANWIAVILGIFIVDSGFHHIHNGAVRIMAYGWTVSVG